MTCLKKNDLMPVKSLPKRPKKPPRRSRTSPRRPQDVPRRPKTHPRRPQDAPQTAQDAPKTPPRHLQNAPKTTQNRPKTSQDAPKTPPDAPGRCQYLARRLQASILQRFSRILARFWEVLGRYPTDFGPKLWMWHAKAVGGSSPRKGEHFPRGEYCVLCSLLLLLKIILECIHAERSEAVDLAREGYGRGKGELSRGEGPSPQVVPGSGAPTALS